jgi:WD40 repeat protein
MTRLHIVLVLVLVGCTETVQLARDPLEQLVSIELSPADPTIKITDLALEHHTLQFTAMGQFADGSTRDITPLVDWNVDNGQIGTFDRRGLFTASHKAAGHGTVTIEARGLVATTKVSVIIFTTIIDPAFPPPAANLFDAAIPIVGGDATRAPALLYPADGTRFPHNIASTLFQWNRGASNDAFRIVFESDVLHLAVETGSDRWQADGDLQRLLAATGNTAPIRTEIQATSSTIAPATIYAGTAITLEFSLDAPGGPLYFWSASTNGIMRGGVEAQAASKLYPSSTTCVGCHTASRDGTMIAMGQDNTLPDATLLTIDTGNLGTVIPANATRPMGWATYSPDSTKLLVAANGVLRLYDARSGALIGNVPLPATRYATHPDWSPDGLYVATALSQQSPTNLDVKGASIARIAYNDGAWGPPEILVSGTMTNNNYFPRYSPDGRWLAFVHATEASRGAKSAELMLVPSAGGMAKPLSRASHRVGTQDNVPDLASSMPVWAPRSLTTTGFEHDWLAFVSARPFGAVLPLGGRGQIWVTSLDFDATGDPSSAAFWLPCQDTTVLNSNPVWSKTDFTL